MEADVVYAGSSGRLLGSGCTQVTCSGCKEFVSVVTENYERTKRAAKRSGCTVGILCPDCFEEQVRRRPPAITIRDRVAAPAGMN